jgi:hypothetical protein
VNDPDEEGATELAGGLTKARNVSLFIDRAGCLAYIDRAEERFREALGKQQ